MGALKIVALGGGHGLYATLTAMRYLSRDVTAVVTVADDGGSSGRMRAELDVIPPGDLRMALAALMSAPRRWPIGPRAPTVIGARCGPTPFSTGSAAGEHWPDIRWAIFCWPVCPNSSVIRWPHSTS